MVTTYFKNMVADNIWGVSSAIQFPTTYYIALSITEPNMDGTGVTEPISEPNYARVPLTEMSVAVDGESTNKNALSWEKTTVSIDEPVSYWAMFDSLTGGNLLMGDLLDSPKHLDVGTVIVVNPGALVFNVLGRDES